MSGLIKRLKSLIEQETNARGRFAELEEKTGISANSWKSFWHGRQRPTSEMIEAVGKVWVEYAFWLVTGICDNEYGHAAPGNAGYPHKSTRQQSSVTFFHATIESHSEAERLTTKWMLATFDDDLISITDQDTWDMMLRSIAQLWDVDADTAKLYELQRREKIAAKLRMAEILLQTNIPKLDYEQTSELIPAIENLIRDASDASQKAGYELNTAKVLEALSNEKKRISNWQTRTAKKSADDN